MYEEDFAIVKYIVFDILNHKHQLTDQTHKNIEFKFEVTKWLQVSFVAKDQVFLDKIVSTILFRFDEFFGYKEKLDLLKMINRSQNSSKNSLTSEQEKNFSVLYSSLIFKENDYFVKNSDFWKQILDLDFKIKHFKVILSHSFEYFMKLFVFVDDKYDILDEIFQFNDLFDFLDFLHFF